MNTNTKTEAAAYAEMQRLADERKKWAIVLCSGASCKSGRRECATPERCDGDVVMLGTWLIVAILTIAAAAVWVLA